MEHGLDPHEYCNNTLHVVHQQTMLSTDGWEYYTIILFMIYKLTYYHNNIEQTYY